MVHKEKEFSASSNWQNIDILNQHWCILFNWVIPSSFPNLIISARIANVLTNSINHKQMQQIPSLSTKNNPYPVTTSRVNISHLANLHRPPDSMWSNARASGHGETNCCTTVDLFGWGEIQSQRHSLPCTSHPSQTCDCTCSAGVVVGFFCFLVQWL